MASSTTIVKLLGIGLISTAVVANINIPTITKAMAQTIAYFSKSPRLLGAVTTFQGVRVRGATYYFNVELPEDAGQPLAKIIINQRRGQDEIDFNLDKTVAYIGTHRRRSESLNLSSVTQDEETEAIEIAFDSPITPGTNFTIGLKPKRNPDYAGVYLLGVTAVPAGDNPRSLYLGPGRLQFYRGDGNIFDR